MNSDDYAKYGLMRVMGWVVAHPWTSLGVLYVIKTPALHPFGKAVAVNTARATGNFLWWNARAIGQHLVKPAVKEVAAQVTKRYIQSRAALQISQWGFGVGVGGAAFSLAAIGVTIAAGIGQSGIQMAEGQKEYEEHAIRIGGGRQVVI